MWQLELLSWVVPAFGALAREFTENEHQDAKLRRDAQECYADMVTIGLAVCMSNGEWTSELDSIDVTKLLTALETRFPTKRRAFPMFFPASNPREPTALEPSNRKDFPGLNALASSVRLIGWDGYEECSEMPNHSKEKRKPYLDILGKDVLLFHKTEKHDDDKRDKFLKRVRRAAKHLLDAYFREHSGNDGDTFNLSQHPSHGMKDFADRVYSILERHWRCDCSQRAARPSGAREARLSLVRHRQLSLEIPARINTLKTQFPATFEVLLPVCKDTIEWKVTNVEVSNSYSQVAAARPRAPVKNDVCRYLLESDETLQVDFLVEHDKFWHLKPKLLEAHKHHTSMEPLQRLLGDGLEVSYISKCNPREQLILCYILANSMLYLYPSSWLQTEWTSAMVCFSRRSNSSTLPVLTSPYVSVELHDGKKPQDSPHHMQYHTHPAILALGIIFLEIITGNRFEKTREPTMWQQRNRDNHQALQLLNNLERRNRHHRTNRISSGLSMAIRACLKLEPPPTFPCNQLTEEGPIRYYILSRILQPLAQELQDGYKVSLDELHRNLVPEKDREEEFDDDGLKGVSRRSTASIGSGNLTNKNTNALKCAIKTSASLAADVETSFAEIREACLYRDREEVVDINKVKAAQIWFDWHNDALARIAELRIPNFPETQQVKIAILDSGVELSRDNHDMYNNDSQIKYKSWVDSNTEWKDEVGHGTHLAVLLRKIAPSALIHVGRVFKKRPTRSSVDKIAQALRYAVDEWKVDIIVMSFGFGEEHEELYDAIQHANFNGVLMFAAASNDGKNRPDGVAWPAQDMSVICVHSGDGFGAPSTFTPDPQDSMRIMVLGECVQSAWPPHLKSISDQRLMSGTSCAAPIAAGIAALVLDYARGFLSQQEWERLRRVSSMRRVFKSMKDGEGGYWWIKHWKWFDSRRTEGWIQGEIRGII